MAPSARRATDQRRSTVSSCMMQTHRRKRTTYARASRVPSPSSHTSHISSQPDLRRTFTTRNCTRSVCLPILVTIFFFTLILQRYVPAANLHQSFDAQLLTNFSVRADGMVFATLPRNTRAQLVIHAFTTHVPSPQPQPRLHRLAALLDLQRATTPTYDAYVPVTHLITHSSRHVARKLMRRFNHATLSALPRSAALQVSVQPLSSERSLQRFSALHRPAVEPYQWACVLRSARSCAQSADAECVWIREMLLLLYVGGCRPLGDATLWRERHGEQRLLTTGDGCFGEGVAAAASLSVLLRYGALQDALLRRRLQRARSLPYGIGSRARRALQLVT